MNYTILQTPGDPAHVVDALASVGSGTPDQAGVQASHGWTSVRLENEAAAGSFGPLLVGLLKVPVLAWSVDDTRCRVTYYRPTGDPIEASDRAEDVDRLVKAFTDSVTTLAAEDESGSSQAKALEAGAGTPQDQHRALAQRLGVPYVVPGQTAQPSVVKPSLTESSLPLGAQDFRRRASLRNTRSWLHFASGLGLVAILLLVIRGPWIGIPIAAVVIGILQLVRYLLGRSLPREG
ncbi:hypothetical protein [Tenggerimyces flavus]|uniref:Uncharacterized protein n=1 Tax=Tenggerimyces flavus TaxID=1708749 RepID=A0ABV7YIC9_9ACTN|nr:hypothetical protein [Tenggerimyces flavus]MBM7789869.1 hypothetical protein [Tenggerimyces flavus]